MLIGMASGCLKFGSESILTAVIAPEQGHVPYTAQIVAIAPPGTFKFELPDATIEQNEGVLEVLVDSLIWTATVTWTDGDVVERVEVTALATNPRPTINRPLINGISSVWYLEPRERTVIDFSYRPATMTSPQTGIDYPGDWTIREISVECSLKLLCEKPIPDSIYHASLAGPAPEDACIVYPTSTYEIASNGLPYSPTAAEGYMHDGIQNRSLFISITFPAQTATIRVVVEDDFGRLTTAEFAIPV